METAGPEPSGFAAKAKDLQAWRDAVVEASTVSGPLWLSYIFAFLYLAIAAGAVTHKDLFFENPVKLPFLNVELPLTAFFVLGPALFLIVHWYTLLHFAMLAGKVGAFHRELEEQLEDDPNARAGIRRQLPSNIFVQFLAGPRDTREGVFGVMLRLIAWISLILGPVALLVFFELQFLPYHDPAVTWWHRIAVLLDLILIWIIWPSVARSVRFRWGRTRTAIALLCTSLPLLLMFTVATFPGEGLHGEWAGPRIVPTLFAKIDWTWPGTWEDTKPVTLHKFLVGGEVDDVAQRQKSWWSNRLVLPGVDLREHPKFDTKEKSESRPTTLWQGNAGSKTPYW